MHYICVKWRECCLILTKRRYGMFDRLIYKSTIIAEKSLLSCIFAKKIHLRPQQIRLLMDYPGFFSPLFFLILYCSSLFLPFSDVPSCPSHAYLSLLTRQSLSLLCNNIFKNCKLVRSFRIELSRYYPVHIFITAIDYFFQVNTFSGK